MNHINGAQSSTGGTTTTRPGKSTAILLGALLTVLVGSLICVAVALLLKSNLFSANQLSNDESKSLWTFLGVAFGVIATLIGALLTNQHNRRTYLLAEQAKIREQQLARDTEERLKLDTVAKILELVTVDGGYAPRARVAGAIATLMQLHGGAVSVHILGELWEAGAVDSSTAVWLIDRIISDGSSKQDETEQAAEVLALHVSHLVPSREDPHQELCLWPTSQVDYWPAKLSFGTRNSLIAAVAQVLLARELEWWKSGALRSPVRTLVEALQDSELGTCAALILKTLMDRDALQTVRLDTKDVKRIEGMAASAEPTGWFKRVLVQLEAWASEEDVGTSITPVGTLGASPIVSEETSP